MTFAWKLFGLNGRLNRASYIGHSFLCMLCTWAGVGVLVGIGLFGGGSPGSLLVAVCLGIPLVAASPWAAFALGVKRLHDMDLSGAHMIWIYLLGMSGNHVPSNGLKTLLMGAVFGVGVWLLCTRGTDGPNRFGQPRVPVRGMAAQRP